MRLSARKPALTSKPHNPGDEPLNRIDMKKLILTVALLMAGLSAANAQFVDRVAYVSKASDLELLRPAGSTTNTYALILGWTAPGDGGMQMYRWTPSSSASTNYGTIASRLDTTGQWIRTPANFGGSAPRTQTLAAASNIVAEASCVRVVGSGGSATLSSTPMIADGDDGEELTIEGTHDTNTIVLSDAGTVANSNLALGSTTRTLGAGDILKLKFNSTLSTWQEVSFVNN
jgi:hypothetical protein